jgi:lipopolysaccharide transport system ATP-binding protein
MNTVVRVEHLSKEYRLGIIGNGSLYKDIQSRIAKIQGKPDPWVAIGEEVKVGRRDRFWALKDVSFDVRAGER